MFSGHPLVLVAAIRGGSKRNVDNDQLLAHTHRLDAELAPISGWIALLKELERTGSGPGKTISWTPRPTGVSAGAGRAGPECNLLHEPGDLDRYLRCLAEVGDTDRYRAGLLANAGCLRGTVLDLHHLDGFLDALLVGLVTIRSPAHPTPMVGFQISPCLIATCLGPIGTAVRPEELQVDEGGHPAAVHRISRDAAGPGTALLTLAEHRAPAPFRVGHAGLVRIGDRMWAVVPGTGDRNDWQLRSGVVDRLDTGPSGALLFRTGITAAQQAVGGPLLNDLGEVVGVLVNGGTTGSVAVAIDPSRLPPGATG